MLYYDHYVAFFPMGKKILNDGFTGILASHSGVANDLFVAIFVLHGKILNVRFTGPAIHFAYMLIGAGNKGGLIRRV